MYDNVTQLDFTKTALHPNITTVRQQMLGSTVSESFCCYLYPIVKCLLVKVPTDVVTESDSISVEYRTTTGVTGQPGQDILPFWYLHWM